MADPASASSAATSTATWTPVPWWSSHPSWRVAAAGLPRYTIQAASPPSQNTSAGAETAASRSASLPPTACQNEASTSPHAWVSSTPSSGQRGTGVPMSGRYQT